jgi:ubiquinone/menaquinone biosynthesis C-methylase UbiE
MWLRVTFPDGETMKIHLTEERSYEDIDVAAHLALYARFTAEVFPKLDSKADQEPIVDCACGSGYGASFISSELGKPVIGVDVDRDAITYARKRYRSTPGMLSFIQADAMDLSVIDTASICSIVSVETIEHIPCPDKVLGEFSRILDPRGALFITTPDASERPSTLVSRFHVREYTLSGFKRLLERHFRSVDVSTSGPYLLGVCRKR